MNASPAGAHYTLPSPESLDRWIFWKPYFDSAGLILAVADGVPIGFVHAGFGPNADQTALDTRQGVICIILVRLAWRRQKIGIQLLQRAEQYLRKQGAEVIFAGGLRPMNPFYYGLYGGSDSPGFLRSDPEAGPFLEANGYKADVTRLVFQKRLEQPLIIVDPRFSTLRKRFEVQMIPRIQIGTWWQECVLGPLDPFEIRLVDKDGCVAASAHYWEMEGYGWRWGCPAAGIMDVNVREDMRRQGIAKLLVLHVLRHLQEQYFGVVEMQVLASNAAGVSLFRSLGFQQVDSGTHTCEYNDQTRFR